MLPFSFSDITKAFAKNDIISIDIGFTNIKIVHVRKRSNNKIKLMNFGIGLTPPGCIKNGVISNLGGIAENLRKVIDENGIDQKNVKIVMSAGSNIISKILFVKKDEGIIFEEALKRELFKQMPVGLDSQKLFYRITGEVNGPDGLYNKVLVTLVPNKTINNYVNVVRLLDFKPLSIDIPFSSVARFFSKGIIIDEQNDRGGINSISSNRGVVAIVDFGSETTNLVVLNNGALDYSRIILAGGRGLDETISDKLDVIREEAETYKKRYGLNNSTSNDELSQVVTECVKEYMEEIIIHIKRSLDFYEKKCLGESIERIFIIGGGSAIKGLKDHMQRILELPVYSIEDMNFTNIEFEGRLDAEKIRFLINALGIAM